MFDYDAAIVGSGPNGLAAAIKLAQSGYTVKIFEAREKVGGGMRSAELTLPGFTHDICSAIHPLGVSSPFFETLPLNQFGLEWIFPAVSLAHPFDDGHSAFLTKSVSETADSLGIDERKYSELVTPLIECWDEIKYDVLSPLKIPSHPILMSKFGFYAVQSAESFITRYFSHKYAKSFFSGMAGHSEIALNNIITSAIGLVLNILGHKVGWPLPKGGSQKIADALASYFKFLGGEIETNHSIKTIKELSSFRVILFDVTPKQILNIVGDKFSTFYKNQLKKFIYGPGVYKLDWALSSPIPFINKKCAKAGTVHIGGNYDEIIKSEFEVSIGKHPEKPFIILAQQSLFDNTRAPKDKHTAWAYCHVPNNSTYDMTQRIEDQIERFAPGFKDIIIERHKMSSNDYEIYNANYVGGDINGGMQNWRQLFTRPVIKLNPYSTSLDGIFICSSSTPPGGGVHGMCGYHAALKAIHYLKRKY